MSEMELERRFYEGRCRAAGNDFERANAAFLECVTGDPTRGDFSAEFLANLKRRTTDGSLVALEDGRAAEAVLRAAREGKWADVLRGGPQALASQPGHVPTLLALAEANQAMGHLAAEICYWNAAVEAASDDLEVQRRAAQRLAQLHEYDAALACWRRVEAAQRDGHEASREILAITLAKSRRQNGLQEGGEKVAVPRKDKRNDLAIKWPIIPKRDGQPGATSTSASGMTLTEIQQLEAQIRDRPAMAEPYLQLAQLYLDKDREYDAERLLAKGREATDHDARVQDLWDEVTMLRHARRVKFAKQEVKEQDNPQTRAAHAQAVKERDRAELDVFRGRCQRRPDDGQSQLQLGLRLKKAGKLPEACEHLEKALASAQHSGAAALVLGECLAALGDVPKALARYRVAGFGGNAEEQKEGLYQAGMLAAKTKLRKLARRYLGDVVARDAAYRDAATVLEGLSGE